MFDSAIHLCSSIPLLDLELLPLKCQPYYLPIDVSAVFVPTVNVPLHANSSVALGIFYDTIRILEKVLAWKLFNHCNLQTMQP